MTKITYKRLNKLLPGEYAYDSEKQVLYFADEKGKLKPIPSIIEVDNLIEYDSSKDIQGKPFEGRMYFEKASGRFYVYSDGTYIAVAN